MLFLLNLEIKNAGMDDKEIQASLEAIDRAGKKVTASKEAAVEFLQRIGVLKANGELHPFFIDHVESGPPSPDESPEIPSA